MYCSMRISLIFIMRHSILNKTPVKYLLGGIVATLIFVLMAQLSQAYNTDLQNFVLSAGIFAPAVYVVITIASIVFAPLGSGFLVPVAANAFGPLLAALYSLAGWFVGSLIAFYLARKYGHGKIKHVKICKKVHLLEKSLGKHHKYVVLILLRIALPVDVLSYTLGLFTSISYRVFIITTFIGIIPFALLFAYASVMPAIFQVVISVVSTVAFLSALYFLITYMPARARK